ncbi:MAG: molybdenum cofactor synthesis domain-containing protein [Butyricicoccus sp.]|nr:molybdenum cofactor synthesis domain-containing protein [Butyricicoccus sp.]
MGKVMAVCVSEARGTPKRNIGRARLRADWGVEGDAHAGNWHRQVSLLSYEAVQAFNARGANVADGAFGENLLVSGFDFKRLPVGTRLRCGDVRLEITQIGKECHSGCEIYQRVGDCIMPREGVFARVLAGGEVAVGDEMTLVHRVGILTASDKGARGEREDVSGPRIRSLLSADYEAVAYTVVPDDRETIARELIRLSDEVGCDLILTTGGTGFAPRDVTPEATRDVCDRMAPGIAEAIRAQSMRITSRAMLSRGVSGIRGRTLIVNLPGSPKAVEESMAVFLDVVGHGLNLLRGTDGECAR